MDEARKITYAEKVAVLGGMCGMSYGKYVATHDTSKFADRKKEEPKSICKKCGKAIVSFSHKKRTVCDDCKAERARQKNREYAERKRAQQQKG